MMSAPATRRAAVAYARPNAPDSVSAACMNRVVRGANRSPPGEPVGACPTTRVTQAGTEPNPRPTNAPVVSMSWHPRDENDDRRPRRDLGGHHPSPGGGPPGPELLRDPSGEVRPGWRH